VDEAYLLAGGHDADGNKDFGEEVLGALIAEMENKRDKLIVILAGYRDEMEKLCEMNPGLRERIPHRIHFSNYSKEELYEIFMTQIESRYSVDEGFFPRAWDFFSRLPEEYIQSKEFGNARFVRNLTERIQMKALLRMNEDMGNTGRISLQTMDLEGALADRDIVDLNEKKRSTRIGFFMEK
jgi:hypothetical protein